MTDELTNRLVADKYLVGELIREGEGGDLYRATHELQSRPVTLRILPAAYAVDQRWTRKFLDEARSASQISHPNILNVTDLGVDSYGIAYAALDALDGENLSDVLAAQGSLDQNRSINIARQSAEAIAAAQEKGQVYGRLSPENIYLTKDEFGNEIVKLTGFGSDPMDVPRNADARFLAPEQCNDFPVADGRSDVFSLGTLLYTMLTGTPPFRGPQRSDVLKQVNAEAPAKLTDIDPDLHPQLDPIILSAIAADPERRYANVAAMKEDLDRIAGNTGIKKAVAAGGQDLWKTAAIVLAGIAVLSAALIYATTTRQTDPTLTAKADPNALPVQPLGPATGSVEDRLAGMVPNGTIDMLSNSNLQTVNADVMPGGDGYNPWANGTTPPAGAPPQSTGGQPPIGTSSGMGGGPVMSVAPGGSQFMPSADANCIPQPSGISLCFAPVAPATPAAQPTPKQMATPMPKNPANSQSKDPQTQPAQPAASDQPTGDLPAKPDDKTTGTNPKAGAKTAKPKAAAADKSDTPKKGGKRQTSGPSGNDAQHVD